MNRAAWIALSAIVVVLGVVAGGLSAFLGGEGGSGTTSVAAPPPAETRGFELPLADDPSVLTLGGHESNLLVGIAARRGGPVEIVALRGETPVPAGELGIAVGGREVDADVVRARLLARLGPGARRSREDADRPAWRASRLVRPSRAAAAGRRRDLRPGTPDDGLPPHVPLHRAAELGRRHGRSHGSTSRRRTGCSCAREASAP